MDITLNPKATKIKNIQIKQSLVNISHTEYTFMNGIKMTSYEASLWVASSRTIEERNERVNAIKQATKTKVKSTLTFEVPTTPDFIPDEHFNETVLLKQISNTKGDEKISTVTQPIGIPDMRPYIYSWPTREPKSLQNMIDILKNSQIQFMVIRAVNAKGELVTIGIGANKQPLYRLKIGFPNPDFDDYKHTHWPLYEFSFYTIPYDHFLLIKFERMLAEGKFGDDTHSAIALQLFKRITHYLKTHFFGNGTLNGMFGRMKAMAKAKAQYNKERTITYDNKYTNDLLKELPAFLATSKFYSVKLDTCDINAILAQQTTIVDDEGIEHQVPVRRKINMRANPGPWYNNTLNTEGEKFKRKDTYWIEPLICTKMMLDLAKPPAEGKTLEGTPEFEKQYSKKSFMRKWASILLFCLFPKAEIYELVDREIKTRCIASYNAAVMIPTQLLIDDVVSAFKNALKAPIYWVPTQDKARPHMRILNQLVEGCYGSLLLSKQSAFKGASKDVITLISKFRKQDVQDGTTFFGIYSDNLYVLFKDVKNKRVIWASLDGSKAESAINSELVSVALQLLMRISITRGNGKFEKPFHEYFTQIFPEIACNGVGVILNQQIRYPAMGSGVQGTYFFNSMKMMELVMTFTSSSNVPFIEQYQDQWVFTDAASAAMMAVGYTLTVESVEIIYDDESGFPFYMNIDLLGYNLTRFELDENGFMYFTVLRDPSLFGLIFFRKKYYDYKGKCLLTTLRENYLKLIRYRAAFLNGAWQYPSLYMLIYRRAVVAHQYLVTHQDEIEADTDLQRYIQETIDEFIPEFESESIISLIYLPVLPTIYELVYLQSNDKPRAIRAVKSRFNRLPYTYLAPIHILEELGVSNEVINQEVDLSSFKIYELYPEFSPGQAGFMRNQAKTSTISKTDILKNTAFNPMPKHAIRQVPSRDIGKPTIKEKNLSKHSKLSEDEIKRNIKLWDELLSDLESKNITAFRVPYPLVHKGQLGDLKYPEEAAKSTFINDISNLTDIEPEKVKAIIKRRLPNVYFTFYPIPELAYVTKDKSLPHVLLEKSIDTSETPLRPGNPLQRAFVSSEVELEKL